MSHTDKTRPRWVKMAEHPMVTSRPHHDHRFGPCTLPTDITAAAAPLIRTGGCRWVPADSVAHLLHDGCRSCTGYWERRADRRRSRHDSRRELLRYRGRPVLDAPQ